MIRIISAVPRDQLTATTSSPPSACIHQCQERSIGLYLGFVGPSDSVDRETLLMSGSLSGARLAKMTRMSVCKYTRPDFEEANLRGHG